MEPMRMKRSKRTTCVETRAAPSPDNVQEYAIRGVQQGCGDVPQRNMETQNFLLQSSETKRETGPLLTDSPTPLQLFPPSPEMHGREDPNPQPVKEIHMIEPRPQDPPHRQPPYTSLSMPPVSDPQNDPGKTSTHGMPVSNPTNYPQEINLDDLSPSQLLQLHPSQLYHTQMNIGQDRNLTPYWMNEFHSYPNTGTEATGANNSMAPQARSLAPVLPSYVEGVSGNYDMAHGYTPNLAPVQPNPRPYQQGVPGKNFNAAPQRTIPNAVYDPSFLARGLPLDPHLRALAYGRHFGAARVDTAEDVEGLFHG